MVSTSEADFVLVTVIAAHTIVPTGKVDVVLVCAWQESLSSLSIALQGHFDCLSMNLYKRCKTAPAPAALSCPT